MFDRTLIAVSPQPSHTYSRSVVHEHRAPTDKSVELLREMEKAALQKLIGTYKLEDNDLKAVWHLMHDDMCLNKIAMIRMRLNGREIQHRITLDAHLSQEKLIEKIRDELVKMLASSLLQNIPFSKVGIAFE